MGPNRLNARQSQISNSVVIVFISMVVHFAQLPLSHSWSWAHYSKPSSQFHGISFTDGVLHASVIFSRSAIFTNALRTMSRETGLDILQCCVFICAAHSRKVTCKVTCIFTWGNSLFGFSVVWSLCRLCRRNVTQTVYRGNQCFVYSTAK